MKISENTFLRNPVFDVNYCLVQAKFGGRGLKLNTTQHRILNVLWKKGRVVRKDISQALGVNPSTVTRNLKDLIEEGIVEIFGILDKSDTVGRKSEIIGISDSWRKIVGVAVERGEVTVVSMNVTGKILGKERKFVEIGRENIIDVVEETISGFLDGSRVVALAVPGVVSDGVIEYSVALSLRDFDIKSELERRIGKSVYVVNDANAAASNFINESSNIVCFLLSVPYNLKEEVGIGAGILIDGILHKGIHNAAGEAGRGVPIGTGGTIEDLKSGRVNEESLLSFAEEIGRKMAVLSQFIDPERVVISGDVSILPAKVKERIKEVMKEELLSEIEVTIDENGNLSVARGAGMALINEAMNDLKVMKDYIL